MKLKNVPGIAGKLPEKEKLYGQPNVLKRTTEEMDIRNEYRKDVLNTDIKLEDIVEVDTKKLKKVMRRNLDLTLTFKGFHELLTEVISKAGVIKWKTKENL